MKFSDISKNKKYLSSFKSRQLIEIDCGFCTKIFLSKKNDIQSKITKGVTNMFCSRSCSYHSMTERTKFECLECNEVLFRTASDVVRNKNVFCCKSCSMSYTNRHKVSGNTRSKLEVWIEEQLTSMYDFEILFNGKNVIGFELDIYIPHLKLGFELNGIFHYEPIFGDQKLSRTKEIDEIKNILCEDNGIQLISIDTREQRKFSVKHSHKYLKLIIDIISSCG